MLIKKIILDRLRSFCEKDNGNIITNCIKRFLVRVKWPYLKIRYIPVIKYLKKNREKNDSILEIGSGSVGITLFLTEKVVGLDLDFSGPKLSYLKMIKGNAETLPFKDFSFDYIICLDMLEHIDYQKRTNVINEMIRVARKTIILGFPSGEKAEEIEQRVRSKYENMHFIERDHFLVQHKRYGLPRIQEVLDALHAGFKRYNADARIKVIYNESIMFWYYSILMNLMNLERKLDFRFIITSIFINLLPCSLFNLGWGGFYRTILIIEKWYEDICSNTNV